MPTRTTRRAALALAALLAVACSDVADPTRPDATSARGLARGGTTPLAGSPIRINEVESNLGTPGDWVELFNTSDAPVDVSGWFFKDDNDTRTFRIAAGTIVPARGFLVLDESQFGFGLGAADQARLFLADGNTLVDSYAWTTHATTTYARCPDGTGAFTTSSIVTKGSTNDCAPVVRINEIESQNGTPGDWIEFFNPNAQAVDLAGHVVRDNVDANAYVFPQGTTIPAGGYLVIDEAQFGFGIGSPDAVRLFRPNGTTLVDSHTWNEHAPTTLGRCPDGTGTFIVTAAPTKGTANACDAPSAVVRINEVESNLGTPGDWVELLNIGTTPVDVSGYVFRDNNDQAGYVIPAGTTIAAGGFLVLEEAQFGFGLGGADQARLFAPGGGTLVDSYEWTTHALTTYGRCPDGTGDWTTTSASTKGARNACAAPPTFDAWPGDGAIASADPGAFFGGNMSGLVFENRADLRSGVLWAVKNGPGTLYRLFAGTPVRLPDGEWANGKALRYPNGTGDVDAEGVTFAAGALYVAAERNNSANSVSRNSILRYDPSQPGTVLTATTEWNLTADIPPTGPNLGLEAIAFVPDAFLVANGFIDQSRNRAYSPSDYPNSAGGIFLVGVEATGTVYAYSLDHVSGGFTRVATFDSGFPQIMELTFDVELGQLWAVCDNGCEGRSTVHRLVGGRFTIAARYERPSGMPNVNNEGFAVAPQRTCVGGRKAAWWADDSNTGSVALRSGTVTCSPVATPTNALIAGWP